MTGRAMSVRTAEPPDAPAIAGISAQEYDSWSSGDFLSTMNNPCARIWVCEEPGEAILGYVVLYFDEYGAELMQIGLVLSDTYSGVKNERLSVLRGDYMARLFEIVEK